VDPYLVKKELFKVGLIYLYFVFCVIGMEVSSSDGGVCMKAGIVLLKIVNSKLAMVGIGDEKCMEPYITKSILQSVSALLHIYPVYIFDACT
jgi:hypothetical protein